MLRRVVSYCGNPQSHWERLTLTVRRSVKRVLTRLPPGHGGGRVAILCYHSIHPVKPFATATPTMFERHLAWLTEHCNVVPLDPSVLQIAGQRQSRSPTVVLTFDDGYDDNFDNALPILNKYGVSATFFLTTGLLQRDPTTMARFRRERRCDDAMLSCLTWPQIHDMRSAGMAFGVHGHTHRNLAALGDNDVVRELTTSRHILEYGLQEPITFMAYPYGKPNIHFTRTRTLPLVRQCDYELAVTTTCRAVRSTDSPLAVPRFFVARDDVGTVEDKVRGRWDVIGWWQEHSPALIQRAVSPADFTH